MAFRVRAVVSIAALLICSPLLSARAQVLFDFEEQVRSSASTVGNYSSLTSTKGGITLSLVRQANEYFDIWDVSAPNYKGCPPTWGERTLSPFWQPASDAFVASFSTSLKYVSIEFGDYNGDAEDLYLNAYSGVGGTGTLLGTATGHLEIPDTIKNGRFWKMSLWSLPGAQSIVFGGSGYAPQSVYWDNLRVHAVPEPAFYQMGGLLALGGLGALRLRKRA